MKHLAANIKLVLYLKVDLCENRKLPAVQDISDIFYELMLRVKTLK